MRLIGLCDESFSRFNIDLPFECLRLLDLRPQNMPRVFKNDEITSKTRCPQRVVFTLCHLNNDEILEFHCASMRSLCIELQSEKLITL